MPQAKLPDINAAFVKYRSYGLICIDIGNYKGAIASLNNINALLPNDYRVNIDDDKFHNLIESKVTAFCKNCDNEVNYKSIEIQNILLDTIESLVSGVESKEVWKCGKCGFVNSLKMTRTKKKELELPYYAKVVPSPPERQDGLINRRDYKKQINQWFFQFLEELENQLGLYRKEYVSIYGDENNADQIQDVELE